MEMDYREVKPKVDNAFMTEFMIGVLSSPIIFIPHYHFNYLDYALTDFLNPNSGLGHSVGLTREDVVEFDIFRGIISFDNKKTIESIRLPQFLSDIIEGESECIDDINKKSIFIFKETLNTLCSDEGSVLQLLHFSSLYEQKQYDVRKTLIFIDNTIPSSIPKALMPYVKVIEIPYPNDDIITSILKEIPISNSIPSDRRQDLFNKFVGLFKGLHQHQIINILNAILIRTNGFLSKFAYRLAETEKKNLVRKTEMIELVDSNVRIKDIGGLDILRNDIKRKAVLFNNISLMQSKSVNLPLPKGILILGMPGCGKSMIAKAIANEFEIPLLRLDIGKLMGKYVGESESNLRDALQAAEATHPCVLWIDEVEKAFAGINNSGNGEGDSLVIRLMGSFLTWMQERKSSVYIVATANDVMKPEFMRKGRFDEVYFVNFPNHIEALEILKKKIERYSHPNSIFDIQFTERELSTIAKEMQCGKYGGFSGAEIEALVTCVFENAFVKYINEGKNHRITLHETDFLTVVQDMRPSIMANQVGCQGQKTNIERIIDVQKNFSFKKASSN